MAKTSLKVKQARKPKFSTRAYTRCKICGRPHSVLKKYGFLLTKVKFRALKKQAGSIRIAKVLWETSQGKEKMTA